MRYAIFYGKNDATQAKEWGKELREAKHKTIVLDSAVIQNYDIEGELNGAIFCDNVEKVARRHVESIYVGIPAVFIEDILDYHAKVTAEKPELAHDKASGDDRAARVRETPRKQRKVK